jgi:hypothetical protein
MSRTQALKEEIQSSLGAGPSPRGKSILRSVTDLFVNRASDYSDEQVEVFDDVMHYLLDYTERFCGPSTSIAKAIGCGA